MKKLSVLMFMMVASLPAFAEEQRVRDDMRSARGRLGEVRDEERFQKSVDRAVEVYGGLRGGRTVRCPRRS